MANNHVAQKARKPACILLAVDLDERRKMKRRAREMEVKTKMRSETAVMTAPVLKTSVIYVEMRLSSDNVCLTHRCR